MATLLLSMYKVLIDGVSVQSLIHAVLLTLAVIESWFLIRRVSRLPPGPRGLPIVGSLPWLAKDSHLVLMNWAKKYGNIFTVNFGSRKVIVLNELETIKEAFLKKSAQFAGRPDLPSLKALLKRKGILSSDHGHGFSARRRFALQLLREMGIGQPKLEEMMQSEVEILVQAIGQHAAAGEPFEVTEMVNLAVANVIFMMVFQKRFDQDDKLFKELLRCVNRNAVLAAAAAAQNFLPFLQIPWLPVNKELAYNRAVIKNTIQTWIQQSKDTYDPAVTRGFLDAMMHEKSRHEGDPEFSDEQLTIMVFDLLCAGYETTATSLRWALFFMLHCPDVQSRVQDELDSLLEDDVTATSYYHRRHSPYTQATLMEINRRSTIVPLGLPRATTEDVSFNGYTIPKNTMVIANLWSVMMNEKYWPEPEEFRPERFLDENGGLLRNKPDAFIPFSVGRRSCIGEAFVKTELFVFFSTILRNFTFTPPEGEELPPVKGKQGLTLTPPRYRLCATPRFSKRVVNASL
ncbi:cytochrome P450 2J2 [Lingula anatina]|uniref:Steroid 21-hydroxylase n=1 Tax=Lingula anatina TaxID=7574 RepID=A0A1S3J5U2_LINAN|nr:cytochrome P450 2J2 [Lingula anatina]|eukprot:XP_013405673.1 cytochrome P450 2J2 [Lingula anatina]